MTVIHPLAATGSVSADGWWAYVAVFALVAVGWAGIPAIGGTVIAAASVSASQGYLNIAGVLVASVVGTEAGGLAGYYVGLRWGRAIMGHPGPWLARRQRAVAVGEALYAKWGRLAVFFTPCLVSGIAKMKQSQFAVWNLFAGAVYVLSVGPAAYGAAQVFSGEHGLGNIGALVAGIAVGAAALALGRRYHRRRQARKNAGLTVVAGDSEKPRP
jgi:membrane protein DedA with SNARE-associated domain